MADHFIGIQVRAKKDQFGAQTELFVFKDEHRSGQQPRPYGAKIEFVEVPPEETKKINYGMEAIGLSETSAQVLIDDLWRCGFRPTEGKGSAGCLAATEKHLNDMRSIVGKQLGVTLERT